MSHDTPEKFIFDKRFEWIVATHWEGGAIYLMTRTMKFARKSDFNQLIPVSGLFVEDPQLKPVVGK